MLCVGAMILRLCLNLFRRRGGASQYAFPARGWKRDRYIVMYVNSQQSTVNIRDDFTGKFRGESSKSLNLAKPDEFALSACD